ncbi:MAG: pyridoxamine 5'-phosphate oxidase family protein [Limibacillus sp.]|jgi:heme iron utilization protein
MSEPTPAEEVRRLLDETDEAALATRLVSEPDGPPYVSLVLLGRDARPGPLLLISQLADHTKNLSADPAASLLLRSDAAGDPLAQARVTLLGRALREPAERREANKAAFLERHPSAALYADFGDFAFWRFETEKAHLVAGFGRIHWLERAELGF